MGRKDAAREVAVAAGVPVVPSYALDGRPATHLRLPRAGQGRGRWRRQGHARRAERRRATTRRSAAAQREAGSRVRRRHDPGREVRRVRPPHRGAGHGRHPRHGAALLRARLLDPAPSPEGAGGGARADDQRGAARGDHVVGASRSPQQCGYTSAGTVEFLLDNATGEFYFLEMNTRLQVEHPVTEEVVRVRDERVDLVELQLRVATGEPLAFAQDDDHPRGPRDRGPRLRRGLLQRLPARRPAARRSCRWASGDGVRVDHALEPEQEVSTSYDPMLGKVIAWGADREAARRRPGRGARRDRDPRASPPTRASCARWRRPTSSATRRSTPPGSTATRCRRPTPALARVFAAWTEVLLDTCPLRRAARPVAGRRLADGQPTRRRTRSSLGDDLVVVDRHRGRSPRRRHPRRTPACRPPTTPSTSSSTAAPSTRCSTSSATPSTSCTAASAGSWERPDPFGDHAAAAGDGTLLAPMPGTVLAVNVAEGQAVAEGETLGVMEAMKMELALKAPFAGTVTTVGATAGDLVKLGAVALRRGAVRMTDLPDDRPRRRPSRARSRSTRSVPATACRTSRRSSRSTVKAEFVRPPRRRRPPDRRGDQLRAPDVGAAARRRRRADGRARRGGPAPPGAGAQRARPRPGPRAGPRARRDLRQRDGDLRQQEPQPHLRRAVRDVRADRGPRPRGRARRAGLRLDVLRRPVGGRRPDRAGRHRRHPAARPRRQPAQPRRHHRRRAPPATSRRSSRPSPRRASAPTGSPCTSTTPTARRWPTPSPRCRRASPPSTPARAASAAAPTRSRATGNLATEDLVWMLTGLGIEHGVDLDAVVATSVVDGRPARPPQPERRRTRPRPAG